MRVLLWPLTPSMQPQKRSNAKFHRRHFNRYTRRMSWAGVTYREHAPASQFANRVECFWTLEAHGAADWLVLPDGCCDIIFSRTDGADLQVVGTMTCGRRFTFNGGERAAGVRFRPAVAAGMLGFRGPEVVDSAIPLEDLWGARARTLSEKLNNAGSLDDTLKVLAEAACGDAPVNHAVQKALAWAARHADEADADSLAHMAGASTRHFRRLCTEHTGLSPKMMCRILRLRRAVSAIHSGRSATARLAAECGYYDQAHMILDFRELAGCTPTDYAGFANGRFFQSPATGGR